MVSVRYGASEALPEPSPRRWNARGVSCLVVALLVLAPVGVGPAAGDATAQPFSGVLTFAGCDSNIPITRRLARIFTQKHPEVRIELKAVGSTNAIAMVAAGALHVGLLSRPLRDGETRPGSTFVPYAKTAVIIGAAPDTPDTGLTSAELLSHYRGTKLQWNSGREVAFLTREQGDSSVGSLGAALPGFAEAYAAGSRTGHWTVLYSEAAMHEALLTIPFALGLSDLGTVIIERLPITPLAIDGVAPTPRNLVSGRYPLTLTLGFVWREDNLPALARTFVEFVQSEEGAEILRSYGYAPVP